MINISKYRQKLLRQKELVSYFEEHTDRISGGFHKVHTDLKVFKRLRNDCIASLLVPAGAKVYAELNVFTYNIHARKMRTNKAFVERIYDISNDEDTDNASSDFDFKFVYTVGETVKPKEKFSPFPARCEPGIHFFLELTDALNWNY